MAPKRYCTLEGGLEPPTLWLTATRSNQLSYSSFVVKREIKIYLKQENFESLEIHVPRQFQGPQRHSVFWVVGFRRNDAVTRRRLVGAPSLRNELLVSRLLLGNGNTGMSFGSVESRTWEVFARVGLRIDDDLAENAI